MDALGTCVSNPSPCLCYIGGPLPGEPILPGNPLPPIPIFDPVCGCDGVTYTSECAADCNQVSIAHVGACETVECPAGGGSDASVQAWFNFPADPDCVGCNYSNPSGGSVTVETLSVGKDYEITFEGLAYMFQCEQTSDGCLPRAWGQVGTSLVSTTPGSDWSCQVEHQIAYSACGTSADSDDLLVRVRCDQAPGFGDGFHILYVR